MRTCPKCYRQVSEKSECDNCGFNVVTMEFPEWKDINETKESKS